MALVINDPYGGGQQEIELGRSRISPRETYSSDPRGIREQYSDSMRNVSALTEALAGFGKAVGNVEKQKQEEELKQTDVLAASIIGQLNGDAPVSDQVAALAPNASPLLRARVAETIGMQQGITQAQKFIEQVTTDQSLTTPEAVQAVLNKRLAEEAARVGKQHFYGPAYISTMTKLFRERGATLSKERVKEMEGISEQGYEMRIQGRADDIMSGRSAPTNSPTSAVTPEEATALRSKITYELGPNRPNKPDETVVLRAAKAVAAINPEWRLVVHSGGGEYGSDRHRAKHGYKAADIYIVDQNGKKINYSEHRAEVNNIFQNLAAMGLKGLGFYGNNPSIHVDDVRVGAWGPTKSGASLPSDLAASIERGRRLGGVSAGSTARLSSFPERSPQAYFGNDVATLPAGMRNNNIGNIKHSEWSSRLPGAVGPSQNTDQGDPQVVFNSPEAGVAGTARLALNKYNGGMTTLNDIIAGEKGWTPGNRQAAANIARTMGISATDDLNLKDEAQMIKFVRALAVQEHGSSASRFKDETITAGVKAGMGDAVATDAERTVAGSLYGRRAEQPQAPRVQVAQGMITASDASPAPSNPRAIALRQMFDEEDARFLAGNDNQIMRQRSKAVQIRQLITLAEKYNDPSLLKEETGAIDWTKLSRDERAKLIAAGEQQENRSWTNYTRARTLEAEKKKAETLAFKTQALTKFREQGTMNGQESGGQDIFQMARNPDGTIDPEREEYLRGLQETSTLSDAQSRAVRDKYLDDIYEAGTTGRWDKFASIDGRIAEAINNGQAPTVDQMRQFFLDRKDISPKDVGVILDKLADNMDGANVLRMERVQKFYDQGPGKTVQNIISNATLSPLVLMRRPAFESEMREKFDNYVMEKVRSSIDEGKGVPRAQLGDIMRAAAEEVRKEVTEEMQSLRSGGSLGSGSPIAPPPRQSPPPANATPVPTQRWIRGPDGRPVLAR